MKTNRSSDHLKSLKGAVKHLAQDARSGTADVGDDLVKLKEELIAALQDGFASAIHGAQHGASGAYQSVRHQAMHARDEVEEVVSRKPLASLAIAAGIGLVVGFLVRRNN